MVRWLRFAGISFASTFLVAFAGALQGRLADLDPVARAEAAATVPVFRLGAAEVEPAPPEPVHVSPAPPLEGRADVEVEPASSWAPPEWFPEEARPALWALAGISGGAGPERRDLRLRSRSVFVYDVDAGRVLLARDDEDRRPVASLTKVVAGLALVSEHPDLDREVCLDATVRPGWPGARTRIRPGTCTTGWDLLGAALVRSDNGAAYALEAVAGLPHWPFVARMNRVAAALGMAQSSFVGPSGVEDENLSTARDMTRAILAASLHPQLSTVLSAPFWDLHTGSGRVRRLLTTNRLAERDDIEVLAAKTGYTDTARYCFAAVLRTRSGRTVAFATLGAPRGRHRWRDARRLVDWVERGVL